MKRQIYETLLDVKGISEATLAALNARGLIIPRKGRRPRPPLLLLSIGRPKPHSALTGPAPPSRLKLSTGYPTNVRS